jgi:signal peptidase I
MIPRRVSSKILLLLAACMGGDVRHLAVGFQTEVVAHRRSKSATWHQGGAVSGESFQLQRFPSRTTSLYMKDENDDTSLGEGNEPSKRGDGLFDSLSRWFQSEDGKEDIKIYFISLFIALLLRFTIVEPRYIPSLSMYPTFEVGDQLAVEKVTKLVKPLYRTEVVVFNPPQTFRDIVEGYGDPNRAREALIKRIVAVEGDRVEVKSGRLYINGVQADEPFTAEAAEYQFGPVVVPPGNVLVLGDNRNHSLDGHIWGFLPKNNVIGRAVFVYWPPWRIGNSGMF